MLPVLQHLLFMLFPLLMIWAAASDLATMTIPNRISLALVASFVVLAPIAGLDLETFGLHWAAGTLVLIVSFAFFAFGWIGGGDAKFAAAIALWLGWTNLLPFVVFAALFGGALTLALLSFRAAVLPGFVVRHAWVRRLHDEKAGVPYGVALAAAALAVYPGTMWAAIVVG